METYIPCQLRVASIDKGITKTEISGLFRGNTLCRWSLEMDGELSLFIEANLPILNGRLCRVTVERKYLVNELNALLLSKQSYKSGKGQQLYFSEALNQRNVLSMPSSCAPRATKFRHLSQTLSRFFVKLKIIDSCRSEKHCFYPSWHTSIKISAAYERQLPHYCTTVAQLHNYKVIMHFMIPCMSGRKLANRCSKLQLLNPLE